MAREPVVELTRMDDDRHPVLDLRDDGIRSRREHGEPWWRSWNLGQLQKTAEQDEAVSAAVEPDRLAIITRPRVKPVGDDCAATRIEDIAKSSEREGLATNVREQALRSSQVLPPSSSENAPVGDGHENPCEIARRDVVPGLVELFVLSRELGSDGCRDIRESAFSQRVARAQFSSVYRLARCFSLCSRGRHGR